MKEDLSGTDVLNLMGEGWELGSDSITKRCWLQKPALCSGDESKNIKRGILDWLLKTNKIKRASRKENDGFWLIRYEEAKGGIKNEPL